MQHKSFRPLALGFAAGSALLITACSNGGTTQPSTSSTPVVPAYSNTVGPVDPVQGALATLGSTAAATPVVGASLDRMTDALGCVVDSVDVLVASLQSLAQSQDPAQFAQLQARLGPAITCGADNTVAALESLIVGGPLAGTPAQAPLTLAIAQLNVLQAMLDAGNISAGNLTAVTNQLVTVSNTLSQSLTQIPAVPNAPQVSFLIAILANTLGDLGSVLTEMGQLDSAGTSAAIAGMVQTLGNSFSSANLTGQDVFDQQFRTAALQVLGATQPVLPQVQSALNTVLGPLFTALTTVLGGVGGSNQFASVISGLLAGNPAGAGLPPVLELLDGGGVTSGGVPVPTLTTVLGGLLG